MGQAPGTKGKLPSSMRHKASSLVSTQSPQQPAPRVPQSCCLTASGARFVRLSCCLSDILGHTPLHRLHSQRAKTSLPRSLGCPGHLTILCYANSDPQDELETVPSGWCGHSLRLPSLSAGQGQPLLQAPGGSLASGPQALSPPGLEDQTGVASTDLR